MKNLVLFILSALFLSSFAVAGDAAAGKAKATACYSCHGEDGNGNSASALWPKLAGQSEAYLVKQMKDFLGPNPKRVEGMMNGMIMSISEADFADVAAYYASLESSRSAVSEKYIEPGETLYRAGNADHKISACAACHGPAGEGIAAAGYPALAGQTPEYIAKQLKMFRDHSRNNDDNEVMQDVTKLMNDAQIEALSHYVSGLHL